MDIGQLNKSQTVLLTLLVSFVTSIATGIVTVALMEQGVTPVTQTINKVVERTKEVVVTQPQVVTEEKTVVVKESDSIAGAVRKNSMSVVAVYVVSMATTSISEMPVESQTASVLLHTDAEQGTEGPVAQTTEPTTTEVATLVGRGVVLQAGVVATDASIVSTGARYKVTFNDGSASYGTVSRSAQGIAVLTLEDALGVGATFGSATLIANDTAVVLSGSAKSRAITVVVAGVDGALIDVGTSDVALGSVLLDTNGTVIGLSTSAVRTQKGSSWFDTSALRALQK